MNFSSTLAVLFSLLCFGLVAVAPAALFRSAESHQIQPNIQLLGRDYTRERDTSDRGSGRRQVMTMPMAAPTAPLVMATHEI